MCKQTFLSLILAATFGQYALWWPSHTFTVNNHPKQRWKWNTCLCSWWLPLTLLPHSDHPHGVSLTPDMSHTQNAYKTLYLHIKVTQRWLWCPVNIHQQVLQSVSFNLTGCDKWKLWLQSTCWTYISISEITEVQAEVSCSYKITEMMSTAHLCLLSGRQML